jgi:hypothetical protein
MDFKMVEPVPKLCPICNLELTVLACPDLSLHICNEKHYEIQVSSSGAAQRHMFFGREQETSFYIKSTMSLRTINFTKNLIMKEIQKIRAALCKFDWSKEGF